MYFFDNHINAFLVEGLHDIPVDAIAVSDNEYGDLVAKRDIGCLLYVDDNQVKATPPQPSPAHEWDGKDWVISPEKQTALFAEQKENLIAQLAIKTDALKAGLLVGYPQTEIDSFYRQEKEALAWQADHNAETPMLKQIALLRGVPFEILVQKVIEKSEMFAMVIGAIIGQRQQLEDRILTATKPEELETIKNEVETWQLPNLS
nr:MAG TPA: tail fiber assembly protein [Caudoviricetes sp.]